jgi:hypothetical protein
MTRKVLFANDCWRPPPSTLRRPMYIGTDVLAAIAPASQPIRGSASTGISGLPQLIVLVSKKLPEGAICATDS